MSKRKTEPSAQFEEALAACSPADFDGHTEFARLTPAERLEWLSQAASFVHENRGRANHPSQSVSRTDRVSGA